MAIATLETWRELDEAISDRSWGSHPQHARPTVVFRGLARSDYSNITSLARLEGDYPALERHLLRNFRKYAYQRAPGPTIWDWLALGQHHGLPTRLLDWTFSPLLALHFPTPPWPDDDRPPVSGRTTRRRSSRATWAARIGCCPRRCGASSSARARCCSPRRCSPRRRRTS